MIRENNLNFTEIAAALQYSTVHHFSPPIQGEVRHHPHGVRPVRTISAAAFRCAGRHKSAMQKNLRCCPIRAEAQASLLPNHRRAACVEDGYFVCFAAYSPASVSCFCRLPF